ncbi:DUF4158 domain-containing protein [Microbispora bryophytorum]|uniref:DUF4158 domain-containing protein n=1 Tax=Microbispora bryophytorum TaxID=1460882 RepID=UPI0033F861A2
MRQEREPEDLIEVWTLLEEDQERLRNKSGANRLGLALLLKFFEVEARFPEDTGEIPVPAVSYVAQQVKVPAEEWAAYDWSGRAIKRHRTEIRAAFGFGECTKEDQAQLAEWLAVELCGVELNRDRLAEAVVARCRNDRREPPTPGRIARLVGSAVSTFEERFCAATVGRLSAATRSRLDDLIAEDAGTDESAGGGGTFFTELKADPGALGLDSLLAEVNKLQRVRALELPSELFGDVSEKLVAAWRARAEKKVEGEFNKELKRVRGKEGILLRLAEAAVAEPGGTVRKVIYPVAGESMLKALAAEAAANEARYRARVRTVLRSSAEGPGSEVQQHRLPAGDGRDRPAQAVPGSAHRQGGRFLRRGGEDSAGRGGARGVAQGGGGRARPGRAHPVRAVRARGAAGRAAAKRHGDPWIKVSPLGKQEEPENLVAVKAEIERRWGTID